MAGGWTGSVEGNGKRLMHDTVAMCKANERWRAQKATLFQFGAGARTCIGKKYVDDPCFLWDRC